MPVASRGFTDTWLYFRVRARPEGGRVVYSALGLFSVPVAGPEAEAVMIGGPEDPAGSIPYYRGFEFSPDGRWVVYRADKGFGTPLELYATDVGAPPFQVLLPFVRR